MKWARLMACENQEPPVDCYSAAVVPHGRTWRRFAISCRRGSLLVALASLLAVLFWLATWERKPTWHIGFLPQGNFLATATGWVGRPDAVRVWDVASGRVAWSVASDKPICSFAFSPDGKTLAIGDVDGAIEWWDLATRAKRFEVSPYHSPVGMLRYSDDGKTLVAMWMALGVIKSYGIAHGAVRELFTVNTGTPGSVAISHDGQRAVFAAASSPETPDHVTIYRLSRDSRDSARLLPFSARGLAFSHDDKRLALAGEGELRIWSLESEKFVDKVKTPGSEFLDIAFSPNDRFLAAAGRGWVALWDVRSGKRLWLASATNAQSRNDQFFFSPVFSPDGRMLAVGDHVFQWSLWRHPTSQALVYDVATGRQLSVLPPNRPFAMIFGGWIVAFAIWAIAWLRTGLERRRIRSACFDVLLLDGIVISAVLVRLESTGVRGNALRLPAATLLGAWAGLFGLLIIWAMLADSRWQWRAPGLIAGWGAMWASLIAVCKALAFGDEGIWRITVGASAMLAALLFVLHLLQKRGLRLAHASDELSFSATNTDLAQVRQFELLDLIAWTCTAALLFGAARLVVPQDRPAVLWLEATLGAGQALTCAAAAWAVFGRGPAIIRLTAVFVVPWLCAYLADQAPTPSGHLPREWYIAFHVSACLLVAASLLVFRLHGLRLERVVPRATI